ncbi:Ig-like domain-containing protein [Mucilaginibacter sp. JRF]|uniref:glucoamylase family protein n=1 Tax=Mucilaginibacter sp. JRF TaxID=2780088 RepID=UPI00188114A7|nr:glucoamylase family protein [Mucilaginibacter sp. JRF]MBE9586732.1 Ig-like domain-containing protein [Mucilaginibacter sp. JRF]
MTVKRILFYIGLVLVTASCSKSGSDTVDPVTPPNQPGSFSFDALRVNGVSSGFNYRNLNISPVIKISFSAALDKSTVKNSVTFKTAAGTAVNYDATYENDDKTIVIKPSSALQNITKYSVDVTTALKASNKGSLQSAISVQLLTAIDSADKFPRISDDALLDLVQRQTFKYFWDFGHPTSGMARERNSSGDVVTTGGSGFGVMALVAAVNRNFITRADGLARMQKIVGFLKTADKFHGAFPHWLNGATGKVQPFSEKDNGADLVETSFLMEGLITARQYFSGAGTAETALRNDINELWNGVEWDWFRRGDQNTLYWHWSPNYNWDMNMQVSGWNEALSVYVLAASSTTHSVPKAVYDNGWAANGAMRNGNTYFGVQLPLGPTQGGPMFFEHYSFMAINPTGLTDAYADYDKQTKAHTMVNHSYCVSNPKQYNGYSADCWGLTASDIKGGYTASSPTNDVGVIAPTAAIASMPYAPEESMKALKFYYYKLGDKLWGDYGFYDAFNLTDPWFADSYLAIDQGPIVTMIENHRSGLLWNLFMSAPEVKNGMKNLGFSGPNL